MRIAEYQVLDTKQALNWKVVSWVDPPITGQIEHHGSSLPGEAMPNDEEIICQGIPFQFPKTDSAANDSISCEGQTIEPNGSDVYSCLAVLGLSVFGDYTEYVQVHYQDGRREELRLSLSDWYQYDKGRECIYGEEPGLVMPYHRQHTAVIERKPAIWLQKVPITEKAPIKRIILPENPYMYLFALTLYNP
jgi:hypothetical protein